MSKNSIFYGVVIFIVVILLVGSMKYYKGTDVGASKHSTKQFGFTNEWVIGN